MTETDLYSQVQHLLIIGDFERTFELLNQAIATHPEWKSLGFSIGEFYRRSGHYEEAIIHYGNNIKSMPDWFMPYTFMGECYMRLYNFEKAIELFEQSNWAAG